MIFELNGIPCSIDPKVRNSVRMMKFVYIHVILKSFLSKPVVIPKVDVSLSYILNEAFGLSMHYHVFPDSFRLALVSIECNLLQYFWWMNSAHNEFLFLKLIYCLVMLHFRLSAGVLNPSPPCFYGLPIFFQLSQLVDLILRLQMNLLNILSIFCYMLWGICRNCIV